MYTESSIVAPLNIVIVGAGIGGLAAAIGLARNGHQITVYERLSSASEVGYAFRITPNSDRCLKYLGIDTVAGGAIAANSNRMFNAQGQMLFQFRENKDAQKAKDGTSVFAYRPQLHKQLMQAALAGGVKVNSDVNVESVDVAKTTVILTSGETILADLIIAADGLHSVVRSHILDSRKYFPEASTGHSALRFMIPKSVMKRDQIMSNMVDNDAHMFSWKGEDKRILVYPVDYDQQYSVTCTYPSSLSNLHQIDENLATAVAYNQKISLNDALSIYKDFDPVARHLFSLADPNGFRAWQLEDMEDHAHWSLDRTTLLGDACHPVSPFGFSGASMAIEDGATLSVLLSPSMQIEDIPDRLELYQEIRRPRVSRVREEARMIAKGLETPESVRNYMMFLSSHNAVEYAEQMLTKFLETISGNGAKKA